MKAAPCSRVLLAATLLFAPVAFAQTMVDTAEVVKRVREGG